MLLSWVVDNHRVRAPEQVHLGLVDVDAMPADGLVAQNPHVVQAEHQALVVLGQAVIEVVDALGHVDVIPRALGLLGGAVFQRLVGEGKGGVHAHHALYHIGIILLRIADRRVVNLLLSECSRCFLRRTNGCSEVGNKTHRFAILQPLREALRYSRLPARFLSGIE